MSGKDVLLFAGPIVLALVAMVSPFVALKLRLRDAREMIRADLEMVQRVPVDYPGRNVLIDSINTRLGVVAELSIPRQYRRDYFGTSFRRQAIALFYFGIFVAVCAYTGAIITDETTKQIVYIVVGVLGAGTTILARVWIDEANTRLRDRLLEKLAVDAQEVRPEDDQT